MLTARCNPVPQRPRPARLVPWVAVAFAFACDPASPVPLFDLGHAGPYTVGVETLTFVDAARGRSLLTEVWYPATEGGTPETPLHLDAHTFRGAPPADGRFPLVLFSHAMQSIRLQSYFLCARLASEGFVVVAPDHPGTTFFDFAPSRLTPALTDQPLDLSFLLDLLPVDPLVGEHADFERVAAVGHSLGGYAVLAIGAGHAKNAVPRDARVKAVVALDAPLFKAPLASAPATLMVSGTRDTVTPPPNQEANHRDAASPKVLASFEGASHLAPASNWCTIADTAECHPPYRVGLDPYEALNELTVDFLRMALEGDAAASARLADTEHRFAGFLHLRSDGL